MSKRSPVVHVEFQSNETGRLESFYRDCFNWKFSEAMPGYFVAETGSKEGGVGLTQIGPELSMKPGIVPYMKVADLSPVEDKVREAGGDIVSPQKSIPGWGRVTLVKEPDGNLIGLWAAEKPVKKKALKKAEKEQAKAAKKAQKQQRKSEKKQDKRA